MSSLKTKSQVKFNLQNLFWKIRLPYKFKKKGVFDGELEKPAEVLAWLDDLLTGADIEQVG